MPCRMLPRFRAFSPLSLLLFFALLWGCGGEKPRCLCVTKAPTANQVCFDICSQGTQCEWKNSVGGRFCECAASQEDCVGKCEVKRTEWILSFGQTHQNIKALKTMVMALGYVGIVSLWNGEGLP